MKTTLSALPLLLVASPLLAHIPDGVDTRTMLSLEGPSGGEGIFNQPIAEVSLASEGIASLADRNLRTRFWTIEPGGFVPIHDHTNRPAQLVVLTGEVIEYSSAAEDPIQHDTGGLSIEEGELAHWWLNDGDETVHMIAFDVYQVNEPPAATDGPPGQDGMVLPQAEGAELELLGAVDIDAHFSDGTGEGLVLSSYRATLQPGGVLPDFTVSGEPLQVFVWEGKVTEHHSDDGAKTLTTRTGGAISGTSTAWWENSDETPAILYFTTVEPVAEVEGVPRTGTLAHGSHGE
ncbi:MAG: hypothetical protein AAGE03_05530 [Pseudomonadota bacterium]